MSYSSYHIGFRGYLMISVEFLVEMSGRDENSRFRGEVQFGAYYFGL